MFLEKYLSEVKFNLLLDTYEEFYLNDLDEEKFFYELNLRRSQSALSNKKTEFIIT